MRSLIQLSDFVFTAASPADQRAGLLGWVSCRMNERLALDGIALRRTLGGQLRLSFPARKDRQGREHPYLRPLDNDTREELERQVIEALRLGEGGAA